MKKGIYAKATKNVTLRGMKSDLKKGDVIAILNKELKSSKCKLIAPLKNGLLERCILKEDDKIITRNFGRIVLPGKGFINTFDKDIKESAEVILEEAEKEIEIQEEVIAEEKEDIAEAKEILAESNDSIEIQEAKEEIESSQEEIEEAKEEILEVIEEAVEAVEEIKETKKSKNKKK